jgi:methyltransferase
VPANLSRESMSTLIHRYFEGCNAADVAMMTACFTPDAVHYFPPGTYGGPFVGADEIARRWVDAVDRLGSIWTVDQLVADPSTGRAVIEWTHFKTAQGVVLRGDEWYVFDPDSGLIREIRAYYATPQRDGLSMHELQGFDYAGRGYPTVAPAAWAALR